MTTTASCYESDLSDMESTDDGHSVRTGGPGRPQSTVWFSDLPRWDETNTDIDDFIDDRGSGYLDINCLDHIHGLDEDEDKFNRLRPRAVHPRRVQSATSRKSTDSLTSSHASYRVIAAQPEVIFMRRKLEEGNQTCHDQRPQSSGTIDHFSVEEKAIIMKFPWMAERLKDAFVNVNQADRRSSSASGHRNQSNSTQQQTRTHGSSAGGGASVTPTGHRPEDEATGARVVFKRNMPYLVFNEVNKKLVDLRVGGDTKPKLTLQEVQSFVAFNPGLRKITMDLENLTKPDKQPIRIAMNYGSATASYNPLSITEDTIRHTQKKEESICGIVTELEKRISTRQQLRKQREERHSDKILQIKEQLGIETRKSGNFVTAKELLAQSLRSRNEDVVLTEAERELERKRRIRLRSKSMATSLKLENLVKLRTRDKVRSKISR